MREGALVSSSFEIGDVLTLRDDNGSRARVKITSGEDVKIGQMVFTIETSRRIGRAGPKNYLVRRQVADENLAYYQSLKTVFISVS